jgi:hypothetical protein
MKIRNLLAHLASIGLVLTFGLVSPANAAPTSSIDTSAARQYALTLCASESELDCVESFGFLDSANKYVPGVLESQSPPGSYTSAQGNQMDSRTMKFSAQVDGKLTSADVEVPLQSPRYRLWQNTDGTWHYGASLRPWVESPDLENIKVRLLVRTSFLKPQNIQLVADESDFKHTKIEGGNLWLFEGKGTKVSTYTHSYDSPDRQDFSAQADVDTRTLHFIIHHADSNMAYGYWPARCADKGYSVQAFNSNAAGEPYWDSRNKSLSFAVPSPHLMASGKPQVGFFKLWTTDAYMNCQWIGNTLATANNITIQIVNSDGSEQIATSSVIHKNGQLYVSSSGFHYSAPTIRVKDASKPFAVSKKKTIVCVNTKNSKVTKKVTAISPKCPAGYKIKK